jgi:uncharacterized protein YunC (DUF1805 family)
MLSSLHKHGIIFLRNLISFTACGALDMSGRNKVAAVPAEMFSGILVWHCFNHRLELAVNHVVFEVNELII